MKEEPLHELKRETGRVIGAAVAEVAGQAIEPKLAPFTEKLNLLCLQLEEVVRAASEKQEAGRREVRRLGRSMEEKLAGLGRMSEEHDQALGILADRLKEEGTGRREIHLLRERLEDGITELKYTAEEQARVLEETLETRLRADIQARLDALLARQEEDARARAYFTDNLGQKMAAHRASLKSNLLVSIAATLAAMLAAGGVLLILLR